MQGANLGATKQSKFFADPELNDISMRLYVPLLENDHILRGWAVQLPTRVGGKRRTVGSPIRLPNVDRFSDARLAAIRNKSLHR